MSNSRKRISTFGLCSDHLTTNISSSSGNADFDPGEASVTVMRNNIRDQRGKIPDNNHYRLDNLSSMFCQLSNFNSCKLTDINGFTNILKDHNIETIKNKDIEVINQLGSDEYGEILKGKWKKEEDVCIQRLRRNTLAYYTQSNNKEMIDNFWRDVHILNSLKGHPNVVALHGVVLDAEESQLIMITEYVPGCSYRHVLADERITLSKHQKLRIARDAAIGIAFMHSRNVIHFDFKSTNVLVDLSDPANPVGKVGDIGIFNFELKYSYAKRALPWKAPELINVRFTENCILSNRVIDAYSFGIVLWEILTDKLPYEEMDDNKVIEGLMSNTLRPTTPDDCKDGQWIGLMEQCWDRDPEKRPPFTEIIRRLDMLLRFNPPGKPRSSRGRVARA